MFCVLIDLLNYEQVPFCHGLNMQIKYSKFRQTLLAFIGDYTWLINRPSTSNAIH